jgi:hypothetical protein
MTTAGYRVNNNGFQIVGHFLKCHKCNKKFFIEIAINGTDHNLSVSAQCAGCVEVSKDFKEEHPEEAKKIEDFCEDVKFWQL